MTDKLSWDQIMRMQERTGGETRQRSPFQRRDMSISELRAAQRANPGSSIAMTGGQAPRLIQSGDRSRFQPESTRHAERTPRRTRRGTRQKKAATPPTKPSKMLPIGAEYKMTTPRDFVNHLREGNPDATVDQIWATVNAAKKVGMFTPPKTASVGHSAFAQNMKAMNDDPRFDNVPTEVKVTVARGLEKGQMLDPETGKIVIAPGAMETTRSQLASGEFSKEIGKSGAKAFTERRQGALDAKKTMFSNVEAIKLLDKGMITGFGAEYKVGLYKLMQAAGIDFKAGEVANTEAYVALRAKEVGRIIKLFGAGTGLSDADREYAEKAAAGKITLNEDSLRKILEISDKTSYHTLTKFRDEISKVPQGSMPHDLSVDMGDFEPYWDVEAYAALIAKEAKARETTATDAPKTINFDDWN